jgi:predicted component of type VI protein secretion system
MFEPRLTSSSSSTVRPAANNASAARAEICGTVEDIPAER